MQPMLDTIARALARLGPRVDAWLTIQAHKYHVQRQSTYDWCSLCERETAPPSREVPEGIVVGVPDEHEAVARDAMAAYRTNPKPGQIVVATKESLYATDRYVTCEQCATPLAIAGDWATCIFVVCGECAHGMSRLEAQLEEYARNEAIERSARARKHLAPVTHRH